MKNHGIVKNAGAWYTLDMVNKDTGEVFLEKKFQSKDFTNIMLENDTLREHCYDSICDTLIMKYNYLAETKKIRFYLLNPNKFQKLNSFHRASLLPNLWQVQDQMIQQ